MITSRLLNALKYEGYTKIASETMRRDGELTDDLNSVFGIAKSACVRFLVDEQEMSEVRRGLSALELLEGLDG